MRAMRLQKISPAILVLAAGLAPMAKAVPGCSVKAKIPAAARIFAKTNERSAWREYQSSEELPTLELNSGMSAQFWKERDKSGSVYIVEPGQDFWTYTHYCFDKRGELEGVAFEIRTPLGWGHRTEGEVTNYGFDTRQFEYFSLRNGKTIPKPPGVGKIPDELKPVLYREVTELPFASLLTDVKKQRSKRAPSTSLASAGSE